MPEKADRVKRDEDEAALRAALMNSIGADVDRMMVTRCGSCGYAGIDHLTAVPPGCTGFKAHEKKPE